MQEPAEIENGFLGVEIMGSLHIAGQCGHHDHRSNFAKLIRALCD